MRYAIVGVLFAALTTILCSTPNVNHYAKSGVVCCVNTQEDWVEFYDSNGELWAFNGADDWCVGDNVAVIMSDNGTNNIYDDSVESVRYERWD